MLADSPLMKQLRLNDLKSEIQLIDRKIAHQQDERSGVSSQTALDNVAKLQKLRKKKTQEAENLGG
jgi:hypothetical protein